MSRTFAAKLMSFAGDENASAITIADCFTRIRDREVVATLLDLVPPGEREDWWHDPGFPETPVNPHNHAPLVIASPTLGPLQRASADEFPVKLASYFAYAKVANASLRKTRFVSLFMSELEAEAYKVGEWGELLFATKREFMPNHETEFSFEPHVDAIHFGVDPKSWPIKQGYEQISALLTIETSHNVPGIVMWNRRPSTRAELNQWITEYRATGKITAIEQAERFTVAPTNGQLLIFNSRHLHAVEACWSHRRTLGTFLVWDAGWKICH
jgi:hypothetical protein